MLPLHLRNKILHYRLYMPRLLESPCICQQRTFDTCLQHHFSSHSRHCTYMTTALPESCVSWPDRANSSRYPFLSCTWQRDTQCTHQGIQSSLARINLCSRPAHHYLQPMSSPRDSPHKYLKCLPLVGLSTYQQHIAGNRILVLQSHCIYLPRTRYK